MEAKARDIPEYVRESTVLKEVYGQLSEGARRELADTMRETSVGTLARVYTESWENRVGVYVLQYEVIGDGAEWVTVVADNNFADFSVVEGEILFNGVKYLTRDYSAALELVKEILRDIAELRNGDPRIGTRAEEYIERFRELLGERL